VRFHRTERKEKRKEKKSVEALLLRILKPLEWHGWTEDRRRVQRRPRVTPMSKDAF
jgi:hypothetical protein